MHYKRWRLHGTTDDAREQKAKRVEKPCSKCGAVKPLGDFRRSSSTPDGRTNTCLECSRAYEKARPKKVSPEQKRRNLDRAREKRREARAAAGKAPYRKALKVQTPDGEAQQCLSCGAIKPLTEFVKRRAVLKSGEERTYVVGVCMECDLERVRAWGERNPSRSRAAARRARARVKREYAEARAAGLVNLGPKLCTQCGSTKPLAEFPPYAYRPDGVGTVCKACELEQIRNYQSRPEIAAKRKQRERERYASDSSRTRANWVRYYERVKESDPERWKQKNAVYIEENREVVYEIKHRRRARKQKAGVYLVLERELKRLYASPCAYCGTRENIEADHIIPIARGGRHSIGNLQPLCRLHNQSKKDKLMVEWLRDLAMREAGDS